MYRIVPSPFSETQAFYEACGNPHTIKFSDTEEFSEDQFWQYMNMYVDTPNAILNGMRVDQDWYGWPRAFWNGYEGFWMIVIRAEKHQQMHTERKVIYRKWSKCNHQFKTTKSKMCYKEYTCDHCGYKKVVDSSD